MQTSTIDEPTVHASCNLQAIIPLFGNPKFDSVSHERGPPTRSEVRHRKTNRIQAIRAHVTFRSKHLQSPWRRIRAEQSASLKLLQAFNGLEGLTGRRNDVIHESSGARVASYSMPPPFGGFSQDSVPVSSTGGIRLDPL
jgi:hypothetical protein